MKRFLLLLIILLTVSASLCLSIKNITRVNGDSMSSRPSPCKCNAASSLAQTPPHTPATDTSMKPAPTSHPTICNISCTTTLISNPSTTPSSTNITTSVIFRIIITILSLLNTNFAWRIHAHHAQQRLRLARENLHLGQA